jgi:uncharacterized coiled-coil protein SlyX
MKEVLEYVITPIVSALVGYVFGFRKRNIDLCGQRLDELEKSLVVYNNIISDLKDKIVDLKNEIQSLELKVDALRKENQSLKSREYEEQ